MAEPVNAICFGGGGLVGTAKALGHLVGLDQIVRQPECRGELKRSFFDYMAEAGVPLRELEGRLVGVRTAGAPNIDLLWGRIPYLDNDGGKKKIKPKKEMIGTVEGSQIRFEWREKDGRIRIKLKVPFEGLDEGDSVDFLLYPDGYAKDPVDLGSANVDEDGKVKLKLRTDHGDPLPLDFMKNVDDLSGMLIRVFHDANVSGGYDEGDPKIDGALPTF